MHQTRSVRALAGVALSLSIGACAPKPTTFSPDGKMACMRGADEMTVPGPKGEPVTMHLQGYSVWRKDADGQWRCAVDIATEAAPVAQARAS